LGTRITSLPYTISAPGAYYLGGNLSYSSGNGITIASDHVTLDLMGFTLTGPGRANSGIYLHARKNVEIRNGTLSEWEYGIQEDSSGVGHRVVNIRAENNKNGIWLSGSSHLIKGCRATPGGPGANGLYIESKGAIRSCQTYNFSESAIVISSYGTIIGNLVQGGGIYAGDSCLIMGNKVSDAATGIYCLSSASIISNTVMTGLGQVGIRISASPVLLDQNTVMGDGTRYQGITPDMTVTRNNAG